MKKISLFDPIAKFRDLVQQKVQLLQDDEATIESILQDLDQKRIEFGLSIQEAQSIIAQAKANK